MRLRSRTLGSVSHLPALLPVLFLALSLASQVRGAPVLQGEADPPSPESTAESGRAAPAGVALSKEEVATPAEVSRTGVASVKRPNPITAAEELSGRAPQEEARAAATGRVLGNAAAPLLPPASAKLAASSPVAADDGDIEIDPDLKEAAKSALRWAHDAKLWVQQARPGSAEGAYKDAESVDGQTSERARVAAEARASLASNAGPGAEQQAQSHDRLGRSDTNFLREGIKFIRDIADHPVTWLVMPILALGMAASWLVQHRSQRDKRRVRGRSVRGQREPAVSGRRRRKGR
jgi:hypothetical protein